jgi:hypothetical protein
MRIQIGSFFGGFKNIQERLKNYIANCEEKFGSLTIALLGSETTALGSNAEWSSCI